MTEEVQRHGGTIESSSAMPSWRSSATPPRTTTIPSGPSRAAGHAGPGCQELDHGQSDVIGASLALQWRANTGSVLAAHGSIHEGYVTGDAVNVAARLQAAAVPGSGRRR
jgi:class 3 adenylate cyclase